MTCKKTEIEGKSERERQHKAKQEALDILWNRRCALLDMVYNIDSLEGFQDLEDYDGVNKAAVSFCHDVITECVMRIITLSGHDSYEIVKSNVIRKIESEIDEYVLFAVSRYVNRPVDERG